MAQAKKVDDKYLATALVSGVVGIAAAIFLSRQCMSSHDNCEEGSSRCHFLTIGAVCALAGAGAALLLAPKSGKELRRDLADTYEDVQDFTKDLKDDVTDRANRWTSKARKTVNKIYDDVDDIQSEYSDSLKDKVMKFIDLAEVGIRIFNSLSKGK